MLVDLVQTVTSDGVTLDGILQRPGTSAETPFDAVLMVHGTGSNFYGSTMMNLLAERFLSMGVATLRVNTRGHDGISVAASTRGGIRLGAAFERVDDCRMDLGAWTDWLQARSGPRIAWLGHSLGAVKCLYAAAHEPRQAPSVLFAISPPRLSYSWFCEHKPEFLADYQKAESLVSAAGSGLIEVRIPLPMFISPAGYVEKYGPDERYNFLRFARSVPCPTLFTFGGQEVEQNVAFTGLPDEIRTWKSKYPNIDVEVIPAADHFYTGKREELVKTTTTWLRGK